MSNLETQSQASSINIQDSTSMSIADRSDPHVKQLSIQSGKEHLASAWLPKTQDPLDIRSIIIRRDSIEYVEDKELKAGKEYSTTYLKALAPIRTILLTLGLLPVLFKHEATGEIAFEHRPYHITSIWFHIQSSLHAILFILVMINTGGTLLNQPPQRAYLDKSAAQLRAEQDYLFIRNLVPVLITLMALLQCFVASYCFYARRHFIAAYFTFWAKALELMRIDAGKGVRNFMYIVISVYFGILLLIVSLGVLQYVPVSQGTPAMLVILTLRVFMPFIHATPYFLKLRIVGSLLFVFIMISSKVHVLLFLFKAKLLKNLLVVWNSRLERVLHRGENNTSQKAKIASRTSFSHLFKDFVCILDLMEGCDIVFANILETYFATQICGFCFEVYYFYRSQAAKEEFDVQRQRDGIIMFLYVARTLFVLVTVSLSAADVAEEAGCGLELVRRKGLLEKKTDEEIYFLLSMYVTYTGHFETALMGGRYFTINRNFLVTMTGLVFTYFVILIQFTPRLLLDVRNNATLESEYLTPVALDQLLGAVENLKY